MSLNPLARLIKSTLNRDPFEEIFHGTPTSDTFEKATSNYMSLSMSQKQQLVARSLKKLSKPKPAEQIIANLVLLHNLIKIDRILIPQNAPQILIENLSQKKQQQATVEASFVKFYFTFVSSTSQEQLCRRDCLSENINRIEKSVKKIVSILKEYMVLEYCLSHSVNQVVLRISLKQTFRQVQTDLTEAIAFMTENCKLIYEDSSENGKANALGLNQIYEDLLHINRNAGKLHALAKKCGVGLSLPSFSPDRETNLKIEMEMNSKRKERVNYRTQKCIASRKNIEEQGADCEQINSCRGGQNKLYHSLGEIDEDQILLEY